MTSFTKAEWLIPTGLIALSVIPVVAGSFRLNQLLGGGIEITPDNARFFAAPLPVVLHIISVTLYCLLGTFQFAPGFRRRKPNLHRTAGRILVPYGLVAALTGLWMTQFYPHVQYDGAILYVIRLLVGTAMILFICLGFAAIRRRDIPSHRPLNDAQLCARPRRGNTGSNPSALVFVPQHTRRAGKNSIHGGGLGYQPCAGRMDSFARTTPQLKGVRRQLFSPGNLRGEQYISRTMFGLRSETK